MEDWLQKRVEENKMELQKLKQDVEEQDEYKTDKKFDLLSRIRQSFRHVM